MLDDQFERRPRKERLWLLETHSHEQVASENFHRMRSM